MGTKRTPEELKLAAFIAKLPLKEKEKKRFVSTIEEVGLNEALVEEIKKQLSDVPAAKEGGEWGKAGKLVEFASMVNHWRLSKNLTHVHRR